MTHLFLGAALASSSTTIIAKVLGDMGKIKEIPSIIMLGILVVEDVFVVIMLAMMQNVRHLTTPYQMYFILYGLLLKLVVFIGGTLIIGGLIASQSN